MRVTTVASVTEQNKNKNPKIRGKQLLRTIFDRYSLIHPTTHPHDPIATLHINNNQQNAAADAYGSPSQNDDLS